MVEFVFPYFMLLAMTPWAMNQVQSVGAQFRVSKKYSYLLSACWQVQTADMLSWKMYLKSYRIILMFVFFLTEPNDESGANVDAAKMWREDRQEFNRIAERIVRKTLGLPPP